ncbi:hypothetical protein [Streptomyces phaeofaciens]|uniref:hypothetical protein n=1 Tax=Streptomyces phaeofaciens TaxID=68254 RepID=UPI0036764EA4
MKDAFFIAAPLFTAASLSLAGVVAGADTAFLLPGLTLLLLTGSSLVLIAAIQLNYYARQFAFTFKDVEERLGHLPGWQMTNSADRVREFARMQRVARKRYVKFANYSVNCFNLGVLLLGLGVASALAPPDDGKQQPWRWVAGAMVLAATTLEALWIRALMAGKRSEPVQVVHHVHQARVGLRHDHGALVGNGGEQQRTGGQPSQTGLVVPGDHQEHGCREQAPAEVDRRVESVPRRPQRVGHAVRDLHVDPWPGGERGQAVAFARAEFARAQGVAQGGRQQNVHGGRGSEPASGVRANPARGGVVRRALGLPAHRLPAPPLHFDQHAGGP